MVTAASMLIQPHIIYIMFPLCWANSMYRVMPIPLFLLPLQQKNLLNKEKSIHQNHTDHSVNKVNKSLSKVVLSSFPSGYSWNYTWL